jgi:hypothetical protein
MPEPSLTDGVVMLRPLANNDASAWLDVLYLSSSVKMSPLEELVAKGLLEGG